MVYRELLAKFEDGLAEIKKEPSNPLQEAIARIDISQKYLSRFREAVVKYSFKNSIEEIEFFKSIKHRPMSLLIYFSEIRSCEMSIPKWDFQAQMDFIGMEMNRINSFINQSKNFRFYMESGATHWDKCYFTRKYLDEAPFQLPGPYFRDSMFNTSHDLLWATLKGFEKYGNYLVGLKTKLESSRIQGNKTGKTRTVYRFTKPATAAMELIYAMKLAGFINHGDFEIKSFVEFFSETFNLDIKDPYGLFKQITQRKSDRNKYLNMLSAALLSELDTRDEYIP